MAINHASRFEKVRGRPVVPEDIQPVLALTAGDRSRNPSWKSGITGVNPDEAGEDLGLALEGLLEVEELLGTEKGFEYRVETALQTYDVENRTFIERVGDYWGIAKTYLTAAVLAIQLHFPRKQEPESIPIETPVVAVTTTSSSFDSVVVKTNYDSAQKRNRDPRDEVLDYFSSNVLIPTTSSLSLSQVLNNCHEHKEKPALYKSCHKKHL